MLADVREERLSKLWRETFGAIRVGAGTLPAMDEILWCFTNGVYAGFVVLHELFRLNSLLGGDIEHVHGR